MREPLQDRPGGRAWVAAVRSVRAVAEAQEGVVSRRQLLACGVSSSRIGRWVARGWLLRLHPGVYALGHRAISPRARLIAALLYAGERGVLSHGTAAHHWGLTRKPPPQIHVSVPVQRRSVPGVVVHTPRTVVRDTHDGLPVTSVARTLMDMAPRIPGWELRKALAEADYRGWLDAGDLRRVMGRGHPGSARLRRAIERHMPELARTLSPLEDRFLLLCERYGIPLLRFTWHDVVHRPAFVAAAVRAALATN
jgi:predicted transcriptional regulator of viral defense system